MASNQQVTITISVATTGDGTSGGITETISVTGANGGSFRGTLSSGRNQLFPGGTFSNVLLIPDPSSAVAKTYDAASTVGGSLATNQPTLLSVPSGSTSVYINAASSDANFRAYFW